MGKYRKERCFKMDRSFVYGWQGDVEPNETVILELPKPNNNQRGINDIGWQCDSDDVELYGTLASRKMWTEDRVWLKIFEGDEINKTTNCLKIINNGGTSALLIFSVSMY